MRSGWLAFRNACSNSHLLTVAGSEGSGLAYRKIAEKSTRTRSDDTSPSLERYPNISFI